MPKKKDDQNKVTNYSDTIIKVMSGAMRGSEIPIKAPVVTLGRATEADIQIRDTLISRAHCRLSWDKGIWYLEDLNSTNGTWMVGRKVEKKVILPLKTSVRVGNTLFELYDIFTGEETQSFVRPFISYRIQPETLAPTSHVEAEAGESLSLIKEENKRLAAIYKFQNLISSIFNEEELCSKILSSVMNIIQGDRSYLLLFDLDTGQFSPFAGRTAEKGKMEAIDSESINQTIVDFVKENHESVLSIDSFDNQRFSNISGLPNVTNSTMCVPMLGKQQLNGMIYITLSSATEKYTEDDLRLLTVMGHTAGMALENSRLVEFNLKNERLVATGTTAAGLSHYIKNILAGLDGSLSLLRMGIKEQDFNLTDEAFNILSKNHRRLGNLVLDLLNLASEQKLSLQVCDISPIIKDVVELIEPQLKQEGISLKVDAEIKKIPLFAEVDAKGVHRVLLNLLINSEQAIQTKQETMDQKDVGTILISAKLSDNNDAVIITVTDDGIGLDKEELETMFDLFTTSKGAIGTGLGLAVSKRIVEAHGGYISASSKKGKGCTLSFALPISHGEISTATQSIQLQSEE